MFTGGDSPTLRKSRGAFFTPPAIADYLARHAVKSPTDRVLDPTCGEGVFLAAGGRRLQALGAAAAAVRDQVFGIDVHTPSLSTAGDLLRREGLDASLIERDFFEVPTPGQLGAVVPFVDAVVGNPPFIRYQEHAGRARARSASAALEQGVRLSGLASSWAALLVHACAFLKQDGRIAMVLPAELLTVGYAEPVRAWLRRRFAQVHLVLFERLQFNDAAENVVLLVAKGSGGCDAFSLYHVNDAEDLADLGPFDNYSVVPASSGKWTDLLMTADERQLFRRTVDSEFAPLKAYGSVELGTVTGANSFFCLTEETRLRYDLQEQVHVIPICPPGSRHLRGPSFTTADWSRLREAGERVWLLRPDGEPSQGLRRYIAFGEATGVHDAYKCQIRTPWWRSPAVAAPDLFFTYMSHRYPRLVRNSASVPHLNSMHGLKLSTAKAVGKASLPILTLNSATMLGAEVHGRSYGGGVLKMEPREAASLPVPSVDMATKAWPLLKSDRQKMSRLLRVGDWTNVVKRVDEVLLREVAGLSPREIETLHLAAQRLRERRLRTPGEASGKRQ